MTSNLDHLVDFQVEVTRSRRRKRSVGSELRGDLLLITVPWWMSDEEIDLWVGRTRAAYRRRRSADRFDLPKRAAALARTHGLKVPTSIVWSDNMERRWGSCTPSTGRIRLSSALAPFPDWVVDYVIVHELAHLDVPAHNAAFWALVHRYPRTERAIGYLTAKGGEVDDPG
jgi:predicted metal-dependent hydrolase